jgi:hypothetical protein
MLIGWAAKFLKLRWYSSQGGVLPRGSMGILMIKPNLTDVPEGSQTRFKHTVNFRGPVRKIH